MVTVSRPILHPFLAPIFTPSICSVLAPIPVQAAETPSFLPATAPTERLTSSITWLDNLGHRLMTNFTRSLTGRSLATNHAERGVQFYISQVGNYAINRRSPHRKLQ